ncbi:MAG TPA: isoaspartyl peptidase/L-asparaginase [Allosphingosinicella sp.]|nr:isoaspartyl peptidase/L-asparaginase [Allosphingosinicella sp.]
MERTGWRLLVHGGAGVFERHLLAPEADQAIRAALDAALASGGLILEAGGSALDAVEAAVKALEDDSNFNAGRGSVFTFDGTNEMDAAIMDGRTRAAGSVTRVIATKNPVGLARAVMELSPHVMLSGEGADLFSREQGLEQAGPEWFATDIRLAQLEEVRASPGAWFDEEMKYGTVGAVARDAQGHVAAATSTGGVTGKRWGRIGDTPIIGAGTWADDRSCAVSATGMGEYFIRTGVAHEIASRIRLNGESVKRAAEAALAEVAALGGIGGVIVVGADGETASPFNSVGMYRGLATAEKRTVAIYGDEEC